MNKEEIRKIIVECLNNYGLDVISFKDGEIWIRGQLVARKGEIVR